ncbi:hypothetical protein AVEN_57157-1 [Araneus ventricosus]|uniref:Uncharacterized protein n=1 Tax=Araneus ventricosus TaxID=182803 RepID=A0A4Y2W9L1_ARAVE|nr:hypothetical protein AVEN_57157-1 [Araneus ventricosus]
MTLMTLISFSDPDPKFKEMRDAMESCSTDQELSSYTQFFKYCGIELSSLDMAGMKNYYCNTSIEDIKRDNECISKKIKEMGKKEEMTKRNEPVEGCMKAAIEAMRKK